MIILALAAAALLGHPTDDATNDIVFPIAAKTGLSASHQALPDNDLRNMGRSVCTGLDAGLSKLQVITLMVTGFNTTDPADPLTDDEAAFVVGASTAAYCPAQS